MKLRNDFKLFIGQYKSGEMTTYFIKNQIRTHDKIIKFSKNLKNKKHNIFIKPQDERICTD